MWSNEHLDRILSNHQSARGEHLRKLEKATSSTVCPTAVQTSTGRLQHEPVIKKLLSLQWNGPDSRQV